MKIQEFTGKTTQEAIDNGLAELGVTIADVHVDVLQEGAKGLFGLFGSNPARVRRASPRRRPMRSRRRNAIMRRWFPLKHLRRPNRPSSSEKIRPQDARRNS